MKILAHNKRAVFDYEILATYEAGLILFGHEAKSIKQGNISLKEAYIDFRDGDLCLLKAHVSLYKPAAGLKVGYDPVRPRHLLLKKSEIAQIMGKKHTSGLTLVPIKIYTKNSFVKLEFGLGQGRKKYDKREVIKQREVKRELSNLKKRAVRG